MKEYIDDLKKEKNVIIYGAGVMARAVFICIKDIVNIECFMVTDKTGLPEFIEKIPVIDIQQGDSRKKKILVLVAVIDKYYKEIIELLADKEYKNIWSVTFESQLWEYIREERVKIEFKKWGKKYYKIEDWLKMPPKEECMKFSVFQVRSHMDKKVLTEVGYDWEIPIQAGADLTTQHITKIKDNKKKSISYKNKEYCELTALYWIWKNDHSAWKGLCHYRRHFELNCEILNKIKNSEIDVILTIPILNFPSVKYMYCHDHIEQDWDIMMIAIKKLCPQYYKTARQLEKGHFYYGYNMLIAKAEIFDRYCAWLFPILEYCENYCKKKKDRYQNRYIGFLSERLMTIYFLYHWEEYIITHCQKRFLGE